MTAETRAGAAVIDGRWRWVLAGAGCALAAIGLLLWIFPVAQTRPAPDSATCPDAASCVVTVDEAPETLLTVLVVAGAALVLVAAAGRAPSTLKLGPVEASWVERASADAAVAAATKAREQGLSDEAVQLGGILAASRARDEVMRTGRPLPDSAVETIADAAVGTAADTLTRAYREATVGPEPNLPVAAGKVLIARQSARESKPSRAEMAAVFRSSDEGRILALAMMEGNPEEADLACILDGLGDGRPGRERTEALRTASAVVPHLTDRPDMERLLAAAEALMARAPTGSAVMLMAAALRRDLTRRLEATAA